ncbi:MAG: regulatory protein RecX [Nostocoides sp.]
MNDGKAAALQQLRAAVKTAEAAPTRSGSDVPSGVPAVEGQTEPAGDPYAVARAIVLRQLTNSPKTRDQLRQALARRNCPDEVAEPVLDRMEAVGLIDDAAYAATLVRSRQEQKGLARRAMRRELRAKGVDDDLVDQALSQVDDAQERRRARELVDKRLNRLHGLDISVQTRRLAGMLARKGYSVEISYPVIRDALADAPEHRRG